MSSTGSHTDNRFDKWWKDLGVRRLIGWQITILVAQMTTGYDEVVVGSLQTMKPWINDMDHPDNSRLGLMSAIVFVGGFVGAFLASPAADYFGRRMGMLIGVTLTFIGTVIQTAAQDSPTFIGGRFLIGLGISFTCVAGPSLLFELAHPDMRAIITSSFNVLWYVGSIICAWTTFGTGHMTSTWSWRIPSLFQGVPPIIIALSVLCGLPESPRWLYSKGRVDEARRILTRYHANGDDSSELVARELEEIKTSLQAERQVKGVYNWGILVKTPANRKRMGIVLAVALLTIWNGQSVISYYFSPILNKIGVTSTTQQTGINGGMQIWNLLWAIAGAVLADRVGRRTLWLTSFCCMILANVPLTICSAMYDQHGSKPAAYLVIVFLFFYNAAFNIANNPLLYCYPTEILPFAIRAKGLAFQIAVSQAALTVNQYVNPIALGNIGYYYFIFYLGMLVLGTAIIYFTFPETKGKSEAELACLFENDSIVTTSIEGLEEGLEAGLKTDVHEKVTPIKQG